MSDDRTTPEPVIRLSLLDAPERLDDDLRLGSAVAAQLVPYGYNALRTYRFLVLDTPAGLLRNQSVYERLLRYQRAPRISLLCLLAGDLEPGPEAQPDSPALRRPHLLKSTSVGLLWAGDVKAAGRRGPGGAPDPQALGELANLLLVPELFDRVLRRLTVSCHGAAAPGVRLLEYDLSPSARDRAWESGAVRFVGQPQQGAVAAGPAGFPEPLDRLAGGSGSGPGTEYARGGTLMAARTACVDAVREAGEAQKDLATQGGLLAGHGMDAFDIALTEVRARLGEYRDQVAAVVDLGAQPPGMLEPAEARLALRELGLTLPATGLTPERVGEGLRKLAAQLFDSGLTLGAVADRFEDCSAEVLPYQDEALAAAPAKVCPPTLLEQGGGGVPPGRRNRSGTRSLVFLAGALAGFGVWPWTGCALAVLALVLYSSVLTTRHLPAAAPRTRAWFGPRHLLAQGVAALLGGAAGGAAGILWHLPTWSAPVGLPFGLALAWLAVLREWNWAVDQIWRDSGAGALQRAVRGLDDILDTAVRQRWWAEAERTGCAESARSVSVVLSTVAETVRTEAAAGVSGPEPLPDVDSDAWDGQPDGSDADQDTGPELPTWMRAGGPAGASGGSRYPGGRSGAAGDDRPPPWLDRESGDGGPDLVVTLGNDFTDLVVRALEPYWESVKRGHAASGSEKQVARTVGELLGVARRHLLRNGVVPAPGFADLRRGRSGPAGLLGLSLDRVAEAAGPRADRDRVVQLTSPAQLPLLSRDPAAVQWIRFAPEALRTLLDSRDGGQDPDGDEEAVWTSSGRYAGQLRLTSLRAGALETVTPYNDAEEDTHGGYGDDYGEASERPADTPAPPPYRADPAPAPERPYSWNERADEEPTW